MTITDHHIPMPTIHPNGRLCDDGLFGGEPASAPAGQPWYFERPACMHFKGQQPQSQHRPPVEEPPNEPDGPPVKEPPPSNPNRQQPPPRPPSRRPPVKEPPNEPDGPPVKEPPPPDPNRQPPSKKVRLNRPKNSNHACRSRAATAPAHIGGHPADSSTLLQLSA